MIECTKCGQDERFVQYASNHERWVKTFFDSNGGLRAEKGVWRPQKKESQDGFTCGACGAVVNFPAKVVDRWHLGDAPIETAPTIDLDDVMRRIRSETHGADLHVVDTLAAAGRFGTIMDLNINLQQEILDGAKRLGAPTGRLYSHQLEALRHAFRGQNVVLQTPTASGKSLCYLLPTFKKLVDDKKATALFVFPAKGLSFDQRRKIAQFTQDYDPDQAKGALWRLQLGDCAVPLGVYDGSTNESTEQRAVKGEARIIVTTPDALHHKILPFFCTNKSGSWQRFLSKLSIVVLDEIHVYRGLFGANVAYVVRRLRMMCERLKSQPQFLCSSATLPEPKSHAEALVGLPFEAVTESGSPRQRKTTILWNPGLQKRTKNKEVGERREPTTDAIEVVAGAFLGQKPPVQTISFIRSLAGVQKFDMTLRKRLESERNPCASKTSTYSGRQGDEERAKISSGLANGQIAHVTSTNALELGIDIGDLNACTMVGYPGTVSSFLQESGRVGRKGPGVVVLLLHDDPLEQWFGRNPDEFFKHLQRVEPIRLPVSNPHVMARQARAAATDLLPEGKGREQLGGLTQPMFERYFGKDAQETVLSVLEGESLLPPKLRDGGGTYWVDKNSSHEAIYESIRDPISAGKFDVVDEGGKNVGVCDSKLVPRDLFPGAIWVNNGRIYESRKINYDEGRVQVSTLQRAEHLTLALQRTNLDPDEDSAQCRESHGYKLWRGGVTVRRSVGQYMKMAAAPESREKPEVFPTKTRPIEFDSTAFWLDLPEKAVEKFGIDSAEKLRAAVHAIEHALRSVFPIVADVDPGDIGSSFDVKEDDDGLSGRIYLFDTHAGGTGLSEFAYENPSKLIGAATRLLKTCACTAAEGCPRCSIIAWCEYQNAHLSKAGALKILSLLEKVR